MPFGFDLAPPAGWTPANVAPPTLSAGSEVAVDRWAAWEAPDDGAGRAVSACFGMDLGTWIEEATPFALERLTATATTVARGLDPDGPPLQVTHVETTPTTHEQAFSPGGEQDGHVVARTVLGFVSVDGPPRVEGCFVLCAPRTLACEQSVVAATANGFVPHPAANALARGVALGIHHPRALASSLVSLFLVAGVLAVRTRPRPRRK